LAVGLLGGTGLRFSNGIPATGMDLKVVLLSAAGCYVALTLVFQRMGRHSRAKGEIVDVTLELEGRRISFPALVDTGNTLTDPVNNRPVLVAEWVTVWPLLPPGLELDAVGLRHPAEALAKLPDGVRRRFRLLPYRAVGVESGLLMALRTDRGRVGETWIDGLLVALSPGPVSDGGSYQGLVGANVCEMSV
jgi:stage II sporulation protein GA (sporulation sigma-E factor processing peptidase)